MEKRYEKDIILHINKVYFPKFFKCVRDASPNEASGLIFGKVEQQKLGEEYQYHYNIGYFECIESNQKSPVAFLLNDEELLYQIAHKVEKDQSLNLIGIFHSHPSGTTPSSMDYHSMKIFYNANIIKFRHLIWIIMDSHNKELEGYIILNNKLTQILVKWEE